MKLLYILYNLSKVRLGLFDYVMKTAKELHISRLEVCADMLLNLVLYNSYFYDYFEYRYFEKTDEEKKRFCDRLLMYRFHKRSNSRYYTNIFTDKLIFPKYFKQFISHQHFILREGNFESFHKWIATNTFKKIVIKHPTGQAGSGVIVCKIDNISNTYYINGQNLRDFHAKMISAGYTLAEEYLIQHEVMQSIFPDSVNTIRIITYMQNGEADILATMVRMGVNKSVDNFSVGGISAEIDALTGIVRSSGVTRDPFDHKEYKTHPVTGNQILGLQIPFWYETIDLVKKAALVVPEVKTVGWDVVITSKGPSLIEGNQNWDKTHLELTCKRGYRDIIENYMYNKNGQVAC